MYCNKVYWGHGVYGVEAASRLYFGKPVKELNLDEAAMIAGIIQGHQRQSPYVNMEAALRRRNYTLDRMAEEGYITAEEAEAAKKRPIVTRGEPTRPQSIAPYFLETRPAASRRQIRRQGGLRRRTRRSGPGSTRRCSAPPTARSTSGCAGSISGAATASPRATSSSREDRSLDTYRHPRWTRDPVEGDIVPALVMNVDGDDDHASASAGGTGRSPTTGYAWTRRRRRRPRQAGDLIEVRVGKVDRKAARFVATSSSSRPLLEGRRGGDRQPHRPGPRDGRRRQLRSARSSTARRRRMRQVGSLFKPFVYTAAIDRGYTALSLLDDAPVSFDAGPGQPPYEPKNYDREVSRAMDHAAASARADRATCRRSG